MFTRQQLVTAAQTLAHVAYVSQKNILDAAACVAFRRAAHEYVATVTDGEYVLNTVEIDPQFYHRNFPGEENVNLDYQVNIPVYRRVDGDEYMIAEVVVGYDHDGFTHCELCYY